MSDVNSLHPGNPVNDAPDKAVSTRSKFKIPRRMFQTARFGELYPHFIMESVPGDKPITLRSVHDVRSYTLKAPLMSGISLKKDYFNVGLPAILPVNWEKIYTNPTIGDDVPENSNCLVDPQKIFNLCQGFLDRAKNAISASPLDDKYALKCVLEWYAVSEYFFSSGSLMRNLGYDLSAYFTYQKTASNMVKVGDVHNFFDYLSEQILLKIFEPSGFDPSTDGSLLNVIIGYGGSAIDVIPAFKDFSRSGYSYDSVCVHEFLQRLRDLPFVEVVSISADAIIDLVGIKDLLDMVVIESWPVGKKLNLGRVYSYQIVCRHFYSNDHIDYVYSAQLYRDLIGSYISNLSGVGTFSYNGLDVRYDVLSEYQLDAFLTSTYADIDQNYDDLAASWLACVFNFQRSLKYVDYFTGAKSQPLAVGNVNVQVANNSVNVIDVTRNIQVQKFLNSVQRSGRKIAEYIRSLFPGTSPRTDMHDPLFLAHTADEIHAVENENTGEAQMTDGSSVTSVLRSNAERYAFQFENNDCPSWIIGISYFDIPRVYINSNDRQVFDKDRFDMFNPYLQFVGDQEVNCMELGIPWDQAFAYQLRDMQYKQSFDLCCGGFVDNLPGWSFNTGFDDLVSQASHISPDFIRSKNYELDRFYVALTGNTLASYFHFVIVSSNFVEASRPMAYSPGIL